ncbi:MAG: PadR family transcriptional regulator [Gammaproteobacteria bacterium]|nr:PadR family transcriptional regulator [Gammaproteobacteria bacterium]
MARADLYQGTLDLMILKSLTAGPMHGYAIARWIKHSSGDYLQVEEGALYPALYRMHSKGLIKSKFGLSENNRKAKYYQLTPKGRRELEKRSSAWRQYAAALATVLAAEPERIQ